MTGRGRWKTAAICLSTTVTLALAACGGTAQDAGSTDGGKIVVGGYDYKSLDPGLPGYINKAVPISLEVYGALFDPPKEEGGDFTPDLAAGYSYSPDFRTLTIDLKQGLTFQDGTPFDAAAVVFNFERYKKPGSVAAQYFGDVESVEAVGDHQVVMHFSAPNATMISFLAYTTATMIASPTAVEKGGNAYGLSPVGAGPFAVTSSKANEELVLAPFAGYWDAADVHLSEIRFINTSPEAQVAYQHVASGSIDSTYVSAVSTPPDVLDDASKNADISVAKDADTLYALLAINTFKAPFDNLSARQALNYCMDRDSIAKDVQHGWVNPAYVLAGSDSLYYPEGGIDGARAQFPYGFDPVKGKALVDQLGGLAFTVYNIGGQAQVIVNALAQQWKQCGIQATVETIQGPELSEAYAKGSYQMAFSFTGGVDDPQLYTGYLDPTTAQGKFGFASAHPEIVDLIRSGKQTSDKAALTQTWRTVWSAMNDLSVALPVISGPNYTFQSKCLEGVEFSTVGPEYKNARLTC